MAALKEVEVGSPRRLDTQRGYTLAVLEHQAGFYEEFLVDALAVASGLLSSGSYPPAIELYQTCLSLEKSVITERSEIEARIGIATALHATGYYHEGLGFLSLAESWPSLQGAHALLTRGRLLLRLDRFNDAWHTLRQARKRYMDLDEGEGVIHCDKEEITLLRDLGHYTEAVHRSYDLISRAEAQVQSSNLLGSCYRALARSLAFTGPLEAALDSGRRALELALDSGSTINVGNANLALGEAYRLGRAPSDAVAFYETAAEIGLTVGNRDSYMWSILGLSDCHFLLDHLSLARKLLAPIGEILRSRPAQYPLEYLHWRLSELAISFVENADIEEECANIVTEYGRLGVSWPNQYFSNLASGAGWSPKYF